MRIAIINGHIIDPHNDVNEKKNLYIQDGKIIQVGNNPDGFQSDVTIDADKLIISPGFVDLCARLREPGLEHKGTIESETRAAAASGITSLCVPPDTDPVIDTPAVVELIHQRNEDAGFIRVYPLAALTRGLAGEHLSEMAHLKAAGCVGVSNMLHPMLNPQVLRRAMEYAASVDMTVFLYPQDVGLANKGCAHEGVISTRLGLAGIPEAAETQAVANFLMLVEQTGTRVHFAHLSTARAVQMIGRAKYDGLDITADVAAHQLHLTEMDIGYFNSQCHVRPPLRTQRDRDALRHAVAVAQIEAICSDHQPHDVDAKLAPFAETEAGISALETLLPLSLRLVNDGILKLPEMIDRLSTTPAEILGINAGHLSVDAPADICIFDPNAHWTLKPENMLSHGHNSPFANWEFQGKVIKTICKGEIVFSQNNQ
jgi:dihydroorotase